METSVGLRYRHGRMSSKRVMHGDIEALWTCLETRMVPSRKRIQACRDMREGKPSFTLPPEFDIPNAQNFLISYPEKMIVPLKTVNVLSRKQPRLERYQVGPTLTAGLTAGNIETWVNAAVEKKINWGELIGKLFLDGECAVVVIPSLADWQHSPDFLDSLSAEEFANLDEESQERYCRVDEYDDPIHDDGKKKKGMDDFKSDERYIKINDDGDPMPDDRYLRDSFKSKDFPYGRSPDHAYYTGEDSGKKKRVFKEHREHSKKAFEEEQKHWLSEELPFRISVVSANQCLPVFGVDQKLIGLVIKRTFTRETLLSNDYIWEEDSDLLLENADNTGEVVLYEYWGQDKDGTPYVAYSVNGSRTQFRSWSGDTEETCDAVIDLRKEFGLRKLPVMYCWGLHFETEDVRMKGIPFLWPVLGAITGVEALSTSILVHSYATAFGSWGVAVDPQILRDFPELLTENNKPRTFKSSPLTLTMLPGRPYPLVHQGVGRDVKDLLNMLRQSASGMSASESVFGGSGATSGHDRALSREYLETSMNQVLDGALQAYQFIGERALEICCGITKVTGVSVPVYATVAVPQVTSHRNKGSQPKQLIELKPEWVGPIYNLHAFYPKSAGENMAELQQLAQLHMQGLVTFREFREMGFGDENPAATLIEIFTDQYLKSDAGRAEIAQIAAEMMGADSNAEKDKLVEEKRLTAGGTPMAALPPELQALNTGQIPPGVDPQLFLTKLQGMMAHDAARNALAPSGPLGPLTGVGSAGGAAGAASQPTQMIPPTMAPAGAPGPAGNPGPGVGEQAPTLPGMAVPNAISGAMGGEIAGAMGTASTLRDQAARAQIGA